MTNGRPRDRHGKLVQQVEDIRDVATFGGAQFISLSSAGRLRKAQFSSKSAEIDTAALQAFQNGAISIPSKTFFCGAAPRAKFPLSEKIDRRTCFCAIFIKKHPDTGRCDNLVRQWVLKAIDAPNHLVSDSSRTPKHRLPSQSVR